MSAFAFRRAVHFAFKTSTANETAVRIGMTVKLLVLAAVGWLSVSIATAQENFPSRPIKLIVAYPAGASADVLARAIARPMSNILGQPVVVENRPGAQGVMGTRGAARSPADGYTLLLGTASTISVEPAVSRNAPYAPVRDFAPVGMVGAVSSMFVVHRYSSIRTMADLVEAARKSPGKLTYGASTPTNSLLMEILKSTTKTDLLAVPYKGTPQELIDILAGRLDVTLTTPAVAMPHIRSGALRPLAFMGSNRMDILPDVPTVAEAGLPSLTYVGWNGVLAPAGTPEAVLEKLNEAVRKSVATAEVQALLRSVSILPATNTRKEFGEMIATDIAKYTAVAEAAGLRVDR